MTLLRASATLVGSLVVASLTMLSSAPPGAEAAVATPSCQGKKATIVGKPGASLDGTKRGDVVVTNGAPFVRTKGGADLVCITGTYPRRQSLSISADKGDDSIVVKADLAPRNRFFVELGAGSDVFRGGPETDILTSNAGAEGDTDVIRTRGGDDIVSEESRGAHSDVDLGDGADQIIYRRLTTDPSGKAHGGSGDDSAVIYLDTDQDRTQDVTLDASDKGNTSITSDAQTVLDSLSGFDAYALQSFKYRHPDRFDLSFIGGGADEELFTSLDILSLDARTAGGDDDVEVIGRSLTTSIEVRGGSGTDVFTYNGFGTIDATLETSTLTDDNAPAATIDWSRVEQFAFGGSGLASRPLTVTGTDGKDHIAVSACRARVDGMAGDDILTAYQGVLRDESDDICGTSQDFGQTTLRGGADDDSLVGYIGDDTLIGGRGSDSADGGKGIDSCDAESTKRCES